ncbi:MAG: hypothetical protein K6G08_05875, partial [Prevotella sp.]|nr:hypothetical protein [Prevotella sp.]
MAKHLFSRQTLLTGLLVVLSQMAVTPAKAQMGTWHAYMAYQEPQQIVKAGSNDLFVRASNGLYQYNLADHSITTYDKVRQLNDTNIRLIAWNQQAKRLIVVYQNSNIDLVDLNGNVTNLSSLYTKSMMQDKTVHVIYVSGAYAYLGTGFGVVKLNVQRGEIAESYILDQSIHAIGISGDNLYLRNGEGNVLVGSLAKNLIDSHNWTAGTAPDGLFDEDLTDWNQYIETVKTLQPGGPKYNHFEFMRFKNNQLYTCGGGWDSTNDLARPATVQIFNEDREWQTLPDDMTGVAGTESSNWKFVDMMAVDVDPLDAKHIIATGRTGMYEYYDNQFRQYYNKDNSLLKNSINSSSNKYVLTLGSLFDSAGNFWCAVSETRGDNLVVYRGDGQWVSRSKSELYNSNQVSLSALKALYEDSRHYLWFVNEHFNLPSFYCYDPATDRMVNSFKTLVNQDGTSYTAFTPYCVTEDLDGNIWVGTSEGPFLIEADRINTPDTYVTQVKVPRNDGTNYADYLMAGAVVNCIVVDGGNRKWMGTAGNGIYLISADNMTQIAHYTANDSPLLSDIIESMAINNATGELFIGTDAGLCSFMTDATDAAIEMVKDDVYAYPNPVEPGYNGLITVVGLSRDADVKVLTTNGQLVAQGRSNGGTFTWNGCDSRGRRVASGIYMVAAATSEGKKG